MADGRELNWDGEIENDGTAFTLLAPGVYDFEVIKFERARFNGSDKLPPCNEAKLTLRVSNSEDTTTITKSLYLHTSVEHFLCAFFVSIGARKHGERLKMDWGKVVGGRGKCEVSVRKWQGRDKEMESNDIKRFLEPDEAIVAEQNGTAKSDIPF